MLKIVTGVLFRMNPWDPPVAPKMLKGRQAGFGRILQGSGFTSSCVSSATESKQDLQGLFFIGSDLLKEPVKGRKYIFLRPQNGDSTIGESNKSP